MCPRTLLNRIPRYHVHHPHPHPLLPQNVPPANRQALFFSLFMPLMILFIFGSMDFGTTGAKSPSASSPTPPTSPPQNSSPKSATSKTFYINEGPLDSELNELKNGNRAHRPPTSTTSSTFPASSTPAELTVYTNEGRLARLRHRTLHRQPIRRQSHLLVNNVPPLFTINKKIRLRPQLPLASNSSSPASSPWPSCKCPSSPWRSSSPSIGKRESSNASWPPHATLAVRHRQHHHPTPHDRRPGRPLHPPRCLLLQSPRQRLLPPPHPHHGPRRTRLPRTRLHHLRTRQIRRRCPSSSVTSSSSRCSSSAPSSSPTPSMPHWMKLPRRQPPLNLLLPGTPRLRHD